MHWSMGRIIYRALLSAFLILGVTFVVIPLLLDWKWDYGVLTELGKALIIAFVLGVTIEPSMRKGASAGRIQRGIRL